VPGTAAGLDDHIEQRSLAAGVVVAEETESGVAAAAVVAAAVAVDFLEKDAEEEAEAAVEKTFFVVCRVVQAAMLSEALLLEKTMLDFTSSS
jgi:uncharacterized protein (DUF169 family)